MRLENPDFYNELLTDDATRSEFDITGLTVRNDKAYSAVKLFFLPDSQGGLASRDLYTQEALASVTKALGVDQFDTLILSLPGVILEKEESDYQSKDFPVDEKTKQAWIGTWKVFLPFPEFADVRSLNRCIAVVGCLN